MILLVMDFALHGTDERMSATLKPLKWYKALGTKKGRQEAGAFPVEGERAVRQVAEGHPEEVQEILVAGDPPAAFQGFEIRRLEEKQLHAVSSAKAPQGVMAVVRIPEDAFSNRPPEHPGRRVLLLEDVQDPGNVGTLIRTAAALDFSGVILTEKCAEPFSPKCVQSTAGSILSVWLRRTSSYLDIVDDLKRSGHSLYAADLTGDRTVGELTAAGSVILALGNEGAGLSEELLKRADARVMIPMALKKAESLNVAACGAILMYAIMEISYG